MIFNQAKVGCAALFITALFSTSVLAKGNGNNSKAGKKIDTFLVKDVNSRKCWHIQGGSSANRTPVWTWDCQANSARFQFKLVPVNKRANIVNGRPTGWFYMVDRNSGKCLHSRGGGYNDRDPLWLWDCEDLMGTEYADRGSFKFVPARAGSYKIKVRSSGKCMHVRGASLADRTEIWTWSCLNPAPDHMRFQLLPIRKRDQL